jgi:hypothetical protein
MADARQYDGLAIQRPSPREPAADLRSATTHFTGNRQRHGAVRRLEFHGIWNYSAKNENIAKAWLAADAEALARAVQQGLIQEVPYEEQED